MQSELDKEIRKFAKKLAVYMNAELEESLGDRVQEKALRIEDEVAYEGGNIVIRMMATGDYWRYIEYGVDGTKNSQGSPYKFKKGYIPSKVVGAKWQQSVGITDPKRILLNIEIKYRGQNQRNRDYRRSLRIKGKKGLPYSEAAKRLSWVLSKSIAKKGLKPRPFIQDAIRGADLDGFNKKIADILGREIIIDLNNLQ